MAARVRALNCADPELTAITQTVEGQVGTLRAILDEGESLYGDFVDTLQTLKTQIREYLAGDTTYEFDSVEWHMIQTYKEGVRTGLDGMVCAGEVTGG